MKEQYSKILVINLMHIGDLLLVTPVLRALRTHYPHAHLALLADAKLSDLVKYNQNIDELILIDKKGRHNELPNYFKFIGSIRKRCFDLVINLHANERASFIAAFSGAKKIIGYTTFGLGLFFTNTLENRKAVKHQIEAHFDVLRELLDITAIDDRGIEMWLDENARQDAMKIWSEAYSDPTTKVVGLNVGASWPTKRWCKEYFAELADKLLGLGYGVAYFGGPMDRTLVNKTISLMKAKDHPLLKVFTGELTLLQLAAMLEKCKVFVTNDSGPMHIAVAMDVPVVTMFGASPVPGFYPYNNKSILIKTPADCHPCGDHQCDTLKCMKEIDPDIVLRYTLDLLAEYGDRQEKLPRELGHYQCAVVEPETFCQKED